jgi:hypothetical protein
VARLTDTAAEALVAGECVVFSEFCVAAEPPSRVWCRRPEGYAYYALDPLAYAATARALRPELNDAALVIGIRSIGTSLSAVVCAELRRLGLRAERITVRPTGHPWDRSLTWTATDEEAIRRFRSASFLIVDEGPGLSGSSFLSVGEALLAQGVPEHRIRFLCSNQVDTSRLLARDAEARFSRFVQRPVRTCDPEHAGLDLSGGAWRAQVFGHPSAWPPSFQSLERRKYMSRDQTHLLKFSGLPPYDTGAKQRAELLREAGWSPNVVGADGGYLAYAWMHGRPLDKRTDRALFLDALPAYLAFRQRNLRAAVERLEELERMTRVNVLEALGVELPASFELPLEAPVFVDGRLLPHEWLLTTEDRLLKLDSADHADDHLFPGPSDAAWDVAGAVVEWELNSEETQVLVERYRRRTGDDIRHRLLDFVIAYSAFRLGVADFACLRVDPAEAERWARARGTYRRRLTATLEQRCWIAA